VFQIETYIIAILKARGSLGPPSNFTGSKLWSFFVGSLWALPLHL